MADAGRPRVPGHGRAARPAEREGPLPDPASTRKLNSPGTALHLQDLRKSYSGRDLLDGISLGIPVGQKVGLIGDNGSGKSTLLSILAGEDEPDSGQVHVRRGLSIAKLAQRPELPPELTARQVLQRTLRPLLAAIEAYETAAAALDPAADDLLTEIERLGGWEWQHRLDRVAQRAGVANLDAPVGRMSGGEQKRVALARLELSGAGILLLDEPTNHLDTSSIEALEAWLLDSPITCVVVTHDRYFLEAVVDRIVELRRGQLRVYEGGYTDYLSARAEEEMLRERHRKRRLQVLKSELEWARRSPKARTTKSRARLDRIDDAKHQQERLKNRANVAEVRFGDGPRLGKQILELDGVTKGFDGRALLEGVDWKLGPGDRWGVVGDNGCGKTTLLRLLMGEVEPDSGAIRFGKNTRAAYLDQDRRDLDPSRSLRTTLCEDGGDFVFPGGHKLHVASWLTRFAFPSKTHGMAVGNLSGGERTRLALARFLLADANLLLLDEPTNDLDLLTLSVFEEALLDYPGCVIVVSHDRYFLDRVSTGVVGFTPEGVVVMRSTGYTGYRRWLSQEQARRQEAAPPSPPAAVPSEPTPRPKGLSWLEKKELDGIEEVISTADARVAELEAEMADADLWVDGHERGLSLQAELDTARAESDRLYARWDALSDKAGPAS